MDLLPLGLAFVSGLTSGIIVLHQVFKNSTPLDTNVAKISGKSSTSRAATRDVMGTDVLPGLTSQLSNLEQQVRRLISLAINV